MREIKLAYLPVIGRGEQINIICAMHDIKVDYLLSTPMGNDFNKDTDAPFGTIPWMKEKANGLQLNDSMAIVQYLVSKYPGPLTPQSPEEAALTAMYWGWAQDYYSFVLSPFHDIITGHNEAFWRNLRLTDTLAEGGKETGISNLTTLHKNRFQSLESHLTASGFDFFNWLWLSLIPFVPSLSWQIITVFHKREAENPSKNRCPVPFSSACRGAGQPG